MARAQRLRRWTLDRLVIREILAPTGVGFLMYTFLLLIRVISSVMEQVLLSGLPVVDAARLFVSALPHVIVLTIPMSFLFGVLVAVGRMSSDNEILALQAGGRSMRTILRPVLVLAVALTILNSVLTLTVMPGANRFQREEKVRLYATSAVIRQIEPRVFYDEFPGLLLYIHGKEPDSDIWRDVLLFDRTSSAELRLLVAKRGRLIDEDELAGTDLSGTAEASSSPWLQLEDVTTHHFSRDEPEKYRVSVNRTQLVKLWTTERPTVSFTFSLQERSTADLLTAAAAPLPDDATTEEREEHVLMRVELHKRIAIPMANVVFALLALPLGIGTRSGGRGRGITLSVLVIVAYYILLNHGELIAREGRVAPWLGIWMPNLILTLGAAPLLLRMGHWLGERQSTFQRIRRWFYRRHGVSANEGKPPVGERVGMPTVREPFRLRFPILLDRYILRRLLPPMAMVIVTAITLRTALDIAEKLDELAKNDVSSLVVLGYYWNMMPSVFVEVTPLALLMAVLVALALLERNHELTAMKAAGLSLYRVVVPILCTAIVGVLALLVVGETVLPGASQRRERLEDTIKARNQDGASPTGLITSDRQWLFSRDGSRLYNFLGFNQEISQMMRVTMFRFDRRHELRFHLFADVVQFRDGAWIAESGWLRQVFPDGSTLFRRFEKPLELAITEAPDYFGREFRSADEMSFLELGRYIDAMTSSGYSPTRLRVRWHQKLTTPISALVLVLIALPFGLNRSGDRRLSTMQGIALALALGIAYNLLLEGLAKAAAASFLPPMIGAWAPIALGLLFGVNRLTTLRT